MNRNVIALIATAAAAIFLSSAQAGQVREVRIGQFPNVTHAQALLARASGAYEKALGVPVNWTQFNAGPSAVEALFADAIDATYIGPNPAINGFVKSEGECFQIVSGSASGGAALVLKPGSGIETEKDFDGKVIATPQLGNTQDVSARAWFHELDYKLKEKGGTLTILPLANPDQLLMMQRGEIDGAWTVEPWVSRLEQEGGGKIFLNEKDLWPQGQYVTTVLVVSRKFIREQPELVAKLVKAHVEMTQKLNADKVGAMKTINEELKRETGKELPELVLRSALERVEFTWQPLQSALFKTAASAHDAGFLKSVPDLGGIYELRFLNDALAALEMGKADDE